MSVEFDMSVKDLSSAVDRAIGDMISKQATSPKTPTNEICFYRNIELYKNIFSKICLGVEFVENTLSFTLTYLGDDKPSIVGICSDYTAEQPSVLFEVDEGAVVVSGEEPESVWSRTVDFILRHHKKACIGF